MFELSLKSMARDWQDLMIFRRLALKSERVLENSHEFFKRVYQEKEVVLVSEESVQGYSHRITIMAGDGNLYYINAIRCRCDDEGAPIDADCLFYVCFEFSHRYKKNHADGAKKLKILISEFGGELELFIKRLRYRFYIYRGGKNEIFKRILRKS